MSSWYSTSLSTGTTLPL